MKVLTILLLFVPVAIAHAQTVRLEAQNNVPIEVHVGTGYEEALLPVTLGAAVGLKVAKRPLVLGVELTVPVVAPSNMNGHLYLAMDMNPKHGWLLRALAGTSILTTQNQAFTATGLQVQLGLLAGYSAPKWLVGAEIIGKLMLFDALATTQFAQTIGGSPTTGGVLWFPAYGFEAGIRAGVLLGPVELALRVGYDRKGVYHLVIPPAYATLSVGVRWGGWKRSY